MLDNNCDVNEESIINELFEIAVLRHKILNATRMNDRDNKLLENCAMFMRELELEKECHLDELRVINQDINTLEESLDDALTIRRLRGPSIEAKDSRIHSEIESLQSVNETLILQNFVVGLVQSTTDALETNRLSNNEISKQFVRLNSTQPSLPYYGDINRQKPCKTCSKLIHRNAPTCPFCKTRVVSKSVRKQRAVV